MKRKPPSQLHNRLNLTITQAMYLLGVSAKTYKAITDKNRESDVAPTYALLIRLLSTHQNLSVIPPRLTMAEFADFLHTSTGVFPRDHASIMLGQTKTWYFKAIRNGDDMSPVAVNLARMYMAKIEREGYEALDEIRKTVEIEAESRGIENPATIWTVGQWPRNIRGKDITMIFQDPMTSLNPSFTVGFQIEETQLRQALFERTGGMYPELVTRSDLNVFLPPISYILE